MRTVLFATWLGLCAATVTSCDRGAAAPASGTTRTLLTDDPFPYSRVASVDLFIVSVSASVSPDTGASGAGGFVTLATPNRRINVLGLQHGLTEELGTAALPTGAITAVKLVIDTDRSSITLKSGAVLTGSSTPGIHWQSSAGRPALNALLHENILVPDTGAVVVVDYDVGQAFIAPQEIDPTSTDSGFIFSPVLRATDATRTGSIAGVVRAHSATGSAVENASLRLYLGTPGTPENTWPMLATAKTDATGAFRFAYVTRSSYWAAIPIHAGKSYIVAVDPPAGSGLGRTLVPNLSVAPRVETAVGTVVLP
ncbi:MAG TPA: DUF4382 domain-containing protein [Gemmatimonadaceae bacterium]|nr:DUF4382 domain-containing protein [Gemmatimonadaceae bacterium]